MRVVKYFLRKWMLVIYALVSLLFTTLIGYLASVGFSLSLFFILLTALCMIGVTDVIFDFKNDAERKVQLLSQRELIILDVVLAIIFCAANIFTYGYIGIAGCLFVPYIILEEKFTVMQKFLMFLMSLYYLTVVSPNGLVISIPTAVFMILSLIIPLFYSAYKRSRAK